MNQTSGNINRSIHAVFREAAAAAGDRTALVCGERRLSYRELAQAADRIAGRLRAAGVCRGQRVGMVVQRSPEAIAAILAILKTGAAYVPFDLSYPASALRQIYEDSQPSLMLLGETPERGPAFWDGQALDLRLDDAAPAEPWDGEGSAEDAAYVMYTSGSTGRPKGVLVPHRAVLRLVLGNDFAAFGSDQVILQMAPLSFDASTFEIWGALLHGGRLAILPATQPTLAQIADTIRRDGVTTAWLTAGLFHLMVDHCIDGLRPLRQLLAGGDVLSLPHVRKALTELPHCRLINGYGPTENTTFSCCYTIPHQPLPEGPIPIGKAIVNTEVHILGAERRPVAEGEAGELYVGGPGLALGYLNRAELTAEKFVEHPFSSVPGARLYRTGDQVRRRPDGNIEFLGRADRQVKINGKRVELDAVEGCLRACRGIADAAVVSFGDAAGRRIAAFVTLTPGTALTPALLRQNLQQGLPDYMLPSRIEILASLPLNPNGKVDRGRLPLPVAGEARPAAAIAAFSQLETTLLGLWQQALGRAAVGLDDNFFDLGGTSLQLIKLHALVQNALKREVPLLELFQYPRIRAQARRLGQQPGTAPSTLLSAAERARRRSAALGASGAARQEKTP